MAEKTSRRPNVFNVDRSCVYSLIIAWIERKKPIEKRGGKEKKKEEKKSKNSCEMFIESYPTQKIDRSIDPRRRWREGQCCFFPFLFFFFFLINVSAWSGERMGGHIRWIHTSSKSPTRYFLDSSSIYTRVRGNSRIDHQGRSSSSPSKSPHSLRPIFTEARTEKRRRRRQTANWRIDCEMARMNGRS